MKIISYICLFLILTVGMSCQGTTQTAQTSRETEESSAGLQQEIPLYSTGERNYDGTGKYYMGREISEIMGHFGAQWLERPEREAEEKGSVLLAKMQLDADAVVADIGAGSGYFSFKLAELVPEGKVYAVDIQPEMLAYIAEKQARLGGKNIEGVLGTETDPKLPKGQVDAVLMVDVYHEFAYPYEMMQAIKTSLSPAGKIFLVEYRGEDPSVPIKPRHKMTARQAILEMEAVGFSFVENISDLPRQHLLVFELK